jgi:uncharacterized protein (TIGR00251 family)
VGVPLIACRRRGAIIAAERDPIASIVRAVEGGVTIAVHVQPRAGQTRIAGRHGDALKIRVAAPPAEGRATEAARVTLASALGVPDAAVTLVAGERSRLKRFRVAGLSESDARDRVNALFSG